MSVFSDAADIIRQRGWYQGDYEGPDGSVCLYGAVLLASGTKDLNGEIRWTSAEATVVEHLRATRQIDESAGIGPWNDDPDRTEDDVLRLLKELDEEYGPVQS